MKNRKPLVLCILDGWGIEKKTESNAVSLAQTPNFDFAVSNYPMTQLCAHGLHVGLNYEQMGNSEVGHVTIGSGRITMMNLLKIDNSIEDGSFLNKKALSNFIQALKTSGGVAHLAGLVSDGGVHGHKRHMVYLANLIAAEGIYVKLHCFLDGRDVPPKSAKIDILNLKKNLNKGVEIATLVGRFFAMDRDNRWERVEKAYRLIAEANGKRYSDPIEAINARYQLGETDEFIEPLAIKGYQGFSSEKDGLFFMNYRADRAREILSSLIDPTFVTFKRKFKYKLVTICGMIEYSDIHKNLMNSLFKPEKINNTLGQWLSVHNKKQFRLAETEKYPHVTFFFNAGVEKPNIGETHFMVASPQVLTYDLKPEMSADEVTANLTEAIESKNYDFIVANYANPDMVGHTGNLTAAVKACEAVDKGLGLVLSAIKNSNGILLITADHGNCEVMYDNHNNMPHTAHTLSLVPFIISGLDDSITLRHGGLSDIAPTILEILSLKKPKEMTGESLIKH